MADQHKNFAISKVVGAPSPATTGTALAITTGDGTKFPTPPFNAVVWPANTQPSTTNAEIVRVTAVSTDTFSTISRSQESTSVRTITVGDQIMAGITAKSLTDIETTKADLSGATFTGAIGFSGTSFAGLNLNNLTSTQRDALTSSDGQAIYNSSLAAAQIRENGVWTNLTNRSFSKTVAPVGVNADYNTDGMADDVEIQAAIAEVNTAGGGVVQLRSGTYTISSPITLPSNIVLEGEGAATIITAVAGFVYTNNMIENANKSTGNSYIVVRNMKLDGNYPNRTGSTAGSNDDEYGHNIMLKNSSYCLLQNIVTYQGYNTGLCLAQGTNYCIVSNCTSINAYNHGMLFVSDTAGANRVHNNIISACAVYDPGQGVSAGVGGVGFEFAKYCERNTVVNCTAYSSIEGGLHFFYYCNYNTVVGCTFDTCGFGVAVVSGSDYNTFVGNNIRNSVRCGINASSAFAVRAGQYNAFTGNVITGCQENGIVGSHIGSVFTSNIIDSCGFGASATGNQRYSVYMTGISLVQFSNNRITNGADRGIHFDSSARCIVSNNFIQSCSSHAIFIDATSTATDTQISQNMIDSCAGAGILLLKNCTRFTVSGNTVKSASGTNSGIDLRGATYCTVTGNSCVSNTQYGIKLINDANTVACTYNVISGNTCRLNTLGGVVEQGVADYNIILGNNCNGNATANFSTVGTNDEIGFNIIT